jgi:guanylate kinase
MYALIAIVGVSMAIRRSFVRRLVERLGDKPNLEVVKSFTTAPRLSDADYEYHVFVSEEEFLRRRERNEFFHVERVDGAYYGHRWKDIVDVMVDGNGICLFDKLTRKKIEQLKKFDWELMVLNDLPEDLMPLGVGQMPQGMFFQKPQKGGGDN